MSEKYASIEGTKSFAGKFPDSANGHFHNAQNLTVSSIGIGTYLGNPDEQTDESYKNAIVKYVESGGNVIDTAANYRFQRSERNIGAALKDLAEKGFSRDEILICTKGGYLPFDGSMPRGQTEFANYFNETFVKTGIASPEDLVGRSHCMTPRYLQSQIDQSLSNMGIEGIDVYYIHNPESQLSEISMPEFEARLAQAFEKLEENRVNGKIQFYGVATWNGFRISPQQTGYHSLERMFNIAEKVGGANHGFKFIQVPFNLAMPEALSFQNQQLKGKVKSVFEAAEGLGISVMCSASILQGKLAQNLPDSLKVTLGDVATDALAAIQFVRSTPNVTTALVGMSREKSVDENMSLVKIGPASEDSYSKLFEN